MTTVESPGDAYTMSELGRVAIAAGDVVFVSS